MHKHLRNKIHFFTFTLDFGQIDKKVMVSTIKFQCYKDSQIIKKL